MCQWKEKMYGSVFLSFGNQTQKSRVAGARPNHQPIGGSDPNHQGIWSPPRAGMCLLLQYLLQSCSRGGDKNQPQVIYTKDTSHHTRLFRGPSTNDTKK
jgi:hypothetical protein